MFLTTYNHFSNYNPCHGLLKRCLQTYMHSVQFFHTALCRTCIKVNSRISNILRYLMHLITIFNQSGYAAALARILCIGAGCDLFHTRHFPIGPTCFNNVPNLYDVPEQHGWYTMAEYPLEAAYTMVCIQGSVFFEKSRIINKWYLGVEVPL